MSKQIAIPFFILLLLAACETPAWQKFDFDKAEKLIEADGLGDSLLSISLGEVHYKNPDPTSTWPEIHFYYQSEQNLPPDENFRNQCKRISRKIEPLANFLNTSQVSDYYLSRDGNFVQFGNHFNEDTWAHEGFIFQRNRKASKDSMMFKPVFNENYFAPGEIKEYKDRWFLYANYYGRNDAIHLFEDHE